MRVDGKGGFVNRRGWIPAFAGMTKKTQGLSSLRKQGSIRMDSNFRWNDKKQSAPSVIPAKAGIQPG